MNEDMFTHLLLYGDNTLTDKTNTFLKKICYRISYNKHRASNKLRPLISAATLGILIKISTYL